MTSNITFIKINNNEEHLKFLYEALLSREFNVSHFKMPSFYEHKKFVLNHPYRLWVIIKISNELVGSLYLQKDNSIGIHLNKGNSKFIPKILKEVFRKWKPLPEIKSVRSNKFLMNVATGDHNTSLILEKFGAKKIQTTYRFD